MGSKWVEEMIVFLWKLLEVRPGKAELYYTKTSWDLPENTFPLKAAGGGCYLLCGQFVEAPDLHMQ